MPQSEGQRMMLAAFAYNCKLKDLDSVVAKRNREHARGVREAARYHLENITPDCAALVKFLAQDSRGFKKSQLPDDIRKLRKAFGRDSVAKCQFFPYWKLTEVGYALASLL